MSVDVTAKLVYGYRIEHDELTDRFRELCDDDFQELDGGFDELGEKYAYEIITQDDSYSELSSWHIAIEVPTMVPLYEDPDRPDWVTRYRPMSASELAEAVGNIGSEAVDAALKRLYFEVMGVRPDGEPTIDLYENWW